MADKNGLKADGACSETVTKANSYILKVFLANLLLTVTLIFGRYISQVIIYTILGFYCLKLANKGHVEIPVARPTLKKSILCMAILVSAYPVAYALNVVGLVLSGSTSGVVELPQDSPVVLIITTAVFPAVGEEIAYRGLIQGAFAKQSALYSVLFSALAFALMHMSFPAILYAFFYGCIFGLVRIATGNLIYTVIMHICFNAWNIGILFLCPRGGGYVQSEEVVWPVPVWITVVLFAVPACFMLLRLLCRTGNAGLAQEGYLAKDFISKEGVAVYIMCICITIIFRMCAS